MTLFEIALAVSAICLSGGSIAYTLHVMRNTPKFERADDAKVRRMIETAPRSRFDNALAR